MKLSEMIAELQKLKDEHGDIQIKYYLDEVGVHEDPQLEIITRWRGWGEQYRDEKIVEIK